MIHLSVVIVNYNVKHFLEQCLQSVFKASTNMTVEVFVVDNNSVDGSVEMVRQKFPDVKLIANRTNVGFSIANNQAIKKSQGKYVLLLNPDTIVEEDTFDKVFEFAEKNPESGGIGVKMIDGKGNFLPESKRALPTPSVSFYKIFGLSKLFPNSKTFGKYHLGYLSKDEIHKVDVLSGAFMWLRKEALDKTGLLDETFFMYGEDIDLSYRLQLEGFDNYYFSDTTIIHYKGESTKKGSINYVKIFYQAMIIFAKKHFSDRNAGAFSFLINTAVYFRALIAIFWRTTIRVANPHLDGFAIYYGYKMIIPVWEKWKFNELGYYPDTLTKYLVPAYIFIWLISLFANGAYRKPVKIKNSLTGIIYGTAAILVFYSLLDETLRFSRALILLGAAWASISIPIIRLLLHFTGERSFRLYSSKKKKIVVVGSQDEAKRVENLIKQTGFDPVVFGYVNPSNDEAENFIGRIDQLHEIAEINKIDELVFCAADISSSDIIKSMNELSDLTVEFKIAPKEAVSVIGSSSINTAGELYLISNNSISKPENIKKKRVFDVVVSILILIFSPILALSVKSLRQFYNNTILVLRGKFSWVGYCRKDPRIDELPKIKPGILDVCSSSRKRDISENLATRINLIYSRDFNFRTDLSLIIKSVLNRNL